LTRIVREIEQRLPRKRPSLPAVSMEGATKGRVKHSAEPVGIPERRHLVEEVTEHVSVGRDRTKGAPMRAQTLTEQLYSAGLIDFHEVSAARTVRDLYHDVDRQRSDRRHLASLMYAMCGIKTHEGRHDFDRELFAIVTRACVATVDRPTLGQIGAARSEYGSDRQRTAAGTTILREALKRGAIYLGLVYAEPWRDEASLRRLA
jgi:hypothetical protein